MLDEIIIQGETVIFLPRRIGKDERKKDLFYYELRHGHDWGVPLTLEHEVRSNFFGTVVSKKELKLDSCETRNDCYYELTDEEKDIIVCM